MPFQCNYLWFIHYPNCQVLNSSITKQCYSDISHYQKYIKICIISVVSFFLSPLHSKLYCCFHGNWTLEIVCHACSCEVRELHIFSQNPETIWMWFQRGNFFLTSLRLSEIFCKCKFRIRSLFVLNRDIIWKTTQDFAINS